MPDPLQHQNETDFIRTSIGAEQEHEVTSSDGSSQMSPTGIEISDNSAIISFKQPIISCMAAIVVFILPALLGFYYIYQVGGKMPGFSEHRQGMQSTAQKSDFNFEDFLNLKKYFEKQEAENTNNNLQKEETSGAYKPSMSETEKIHHAFALANSEILIIAVSLLFIAFAIPLLLHLVGLGFSLILLTVAIIQGFCVNYKLMQLLISDGSIASPFAMDALKQAIKANTITPEIAQNYFIHIQYTGFLIWTAISLLIVTLAVVCLRQFNELWPQGLRLRRNILIMTAAFSGLFYAIGIFRLKVTLEWPSQFIQDVNNRELAQASAAEYVHGAGMLFTIQLVLIFAIATATLRNDIAIAGEREYSSLIAREDLENLARFIPATLAFFSPIIAGLPPALMTTIMNFLNSF